jgi:hypothetical protein
LDPLAERIDIHALALEELERREEIGVLGKPKDLQCLTGGIDTDRHLHQRSEKAGVLEAGDIAGQFIELPERLQKRVDEPKDGADPIGERGERLADPGRHDGLDRVLELLLQPVHRTRQGFGDRGVATFERSGVLAGAIREVAHVLERFARLSEDRVEGGPLTS